MRKSLLQKERASKRLRIKLRGIWERREISSCSSYPNCMVQDILKQFNRQSKPGNGETILWNENAL
jgi:hypothetical protein